MLSTIRLGWNEGEYTPPGNLLFFQGLSWSGISWINIMMAAWKWVGNAAWGITLSAYRHIKLFWVGAGSLCMSHPPGIFSVLVPSITHLHQHLQKRPRHSQSTRKNVDLFALLLWLSSPFVGVRQFPDSSCSHRPFTAAWEIYVAPLYRQQAWTNLSKFSTYSIFCPSSLPR